MEIPKGAPLKEVTISKEVFKVPLPFKEGHALRANEADVLNQTWCENIRNNLAKEVATAREKGTLDLAAFQDRVNAYCVEYDFYVSRGGAFTPKDPVEAAALNIARDAVVQALKNKGIKLKDVTRAQITEMAQDVVKKYPQITDRAKQMVKAQQQATADVQVEIPA